MCVPACVRESGWLAAWLGGWLSRCRSGGWLFCMYACLLVWPSACLSVCLSVCLSGCLSARPSVIPSACLSVFVHVHVCVRRSWLTVRLPDSVWTHHGLARMHFELFVCELRAGDLGFGSKLRCLHSRAANNPKYKCTMDAQKHCPADAYGRPMVSSKRAPGTSAALTTKATPSNRTTTTPWCVRHLRPQCRQTTHRRWARPPPQKPRANQNLALSMPAAPWDQTESGALTQRPASPFTRVCGVA